jgi:hypothetical protein
MSTRKPNVNGQMLTENGIFFFSRIHYPDELPQWLQPVSQLLIRRRNKLPRNAAKDLQTELKEFHDPEKAREYRIMDNDSSFDGSDEMWDLQPNNEDYESEAPRRECFGQVNTANPEVLQQLDDCYNISRKFIQLFKTKSHEAQWQQHFGEHIFKEYQNTDDSSDPFK